MDDAERSAEPRGAAAALLPDDEDARAGFADLLDVHELHPGIPGRAARNVLTGYLAVDSNAGDQKGAKSPGLRTIGMLVIDAATTVPGPGQVQNTFDSDTNVSSQINLLRQGQSQVLNGNC